MSNSRLIVLKFGGSVLPDEGALQTAVHEIYRWRREGWRVVAVVSALSGRTDDLVSACDRVAARPSAAACAPLIASGEAECAAMLGLYLDRVGLPASVLTPSAARLIAGGTPLDSSPESVDIPALESALETDGVVVLPGFTAIDSRGRTVTLGRGGFDTTALFLAHALRAERCRLIKDVDGLYTADPAHDRYARRYGSCSYEDALRTDGSIIQHKAIELARTHGVEFEIGRLNGVSPTVVGVGPSRLNELPDHPEPLRIGIAGAGTVGGGLLDHLSRLPESFRITGVACRSEARRDSLERRGLRVVERPHDCAAGSDLLVELIGGTDAAYELVASSLQAGRDVVTANKALLAEHGRELQSIADKHGARLLKSASVGGGLPVLERAVAAPASVVRGVLNGTANFVLSALHDSKPFAEAVDSAQRAGLAEADPSRDLDGRDCIDKLRVIAQALGFDEPRCSSPRIVFPETLGEGRCLRQIGTLRESECAVELEELVPPDPLFDVAGEENSVIIECADGTTEEIRGRGAGRWPTAESVLADLLELSRDRSRNAQLAADAQGYAHAR
ncbi:MAG: hypothetical protein AAFQ71_11850 [Planctomycetota bacterium]